MRALLFITYLFALLLTGGNKMHANTHKISSAPILNLNNSLKGHNKFLHSKKGHSSSKIVNNDFDLNEEYSSNECYNNSGATKIIKLCKKIPTKWYLLIDNSFFTFYNRFSLNMPFNWQNIYIFIFINVLRI